MKTVYPTLFAGQNGKEGFSVVKAYGGMIKLYAEGNTAGCGKEFRGRRKEFRGTLKRIPRDAEKNSAEH